MYPVPGHNPCVVNHCKKIPCITKAKLEKKINVGDLNHIAAWSQKNAP